MKPIVPDGGGHREKAIASVLEVPKEPTRRGLAYRKLAKKNIPLESQPRQRVEAALPQGANSDVFTLAMKFRSVLFDNFSTLIRGNVVRNALKMQSVVPVVFVDSALIKYVAL